MIKNHQCWGLKWNRGILFRKNRILYDLAQKDFPGKMPMWKIANK